MVLVWIRHELAVYCVQYTQDRRYHGKKLRGARTCNIACMSLACVFTSLGLPPHVERLESVPQSARCFSRGAAPLRVADPFELLLAAWRAAQTSAIPAPWQKRRSGKRFNRAASTTASTSASSASSEKSVTFRSERLELPGSDRISARRCVNAAIPCCHTGLARSISRCVTQLLRRSNCFASACLIARLLLEDP